LPEGGQEGTIEDNYRSLPAGSLYAKTGSMQQVHCLSGVVMTQKGKPLFFSFMNNQIPGSNKKWKEEMERLLIRIYELY